MTQFTTTLGRSRGNEIRLAIAVGMPTTGHTPHRTGRGHAPDERDKIMRDGVAIAEAGAFSLVIEGVPRASRAS